MERVVEGDVLDTQHIGSLWRPNLTSTDALATQLAQGLAIDEKGVLVSALNPSRVHGNNGKEIPAPKISLSDVSILFSTSAKDGH